MIFLIGWLYSLISLNDLYYYYFTFPFWSDPFWDVGLVHCGVCEMVQLATFWIPLLVINGKWKSWVNSLSTSLVKSFLVQKIFHVSLRYNFKRYDYMIVIFIDWFIQFLITCVSHWFCTVTYTFCLWWGFYYDIQALCACHMRSI